ncbi:hypothetical protein TWF694_003009 [Orbilia ellipsospora]|uniref:Uncharacterized protein n=1 Tax=Orbilia ellipsospora TaxID=2528407 RepID=A0AAV9X2P0_9PEZI
MRSLWAFSVLFTASSVAAGGCPAPGYHPPPNPTTTPYNYYHGGGGGGGGGGYPTTTMHTTTTTSVTPPSNCNTDACLIAVQINNITSHHGHADCRSYLDSTWWTTISTNSVTGTATTVVVTADSALPTNNPQTAPGLRKRQDTTLGGHSVIPTAIPTYASACSGSVRYRSACSCLGLEARTFTLTNVTRSTITPTVTVTVLAQPTATYRPFILGLSNGAYIAASLDYELANGLNQTAPWDREHAVVFYYDENTRLVYAEGYGVLAVDDSSPPASGPDTRRSFIYLGLQEHKGPLSSLHMEPLQCDISASLQLTCDYNGMNRIGTYQEDSYDFEMVIGAADYDFATDGGEHGVTPEFGGKELPVSVIYIG